MADRLCFVVTGAGNGLGRRLVESGLEKGFHVIGIDRDAPGLAELKALHPEVTTIEGDVSDPATSAAAAAAVANEGGKCIGLVNNAAIMGRRTLEDVEPEYFGQMMDVNCLGPLLHIKLLMPYLEAAGGRIVNIGSVNAYGGGRNLLEYSMSKAALACMTRNLAPSMAAKGVKICQINLGWVLTEWENQRMVDEGMGEGWFENVSREHVPFGRLFRPEEVASFVLLLYSDACALMNGSIIDFAQNAVGMRGIA